MRVFIIFLMIPFQYIADTLPLAEWNEKIANDTMLSVKEITFLSEDTIAYQYFDLDNERRQELLHRIGLEKYQPQDWQEWIANKESVQKITKADTIKVLKAHPSQFWVVNKNEPEQIFKINIPLENLTYPLLLGLEENKNGKTNLEIGNLIIFKSSNNYLKEIDNPNHSSDLSQDQLKTLETHLIKLYTEYNAYHNRDFLTKANRWFTSKMESKSGILDKFK